ncbi:MAG: efflux RND transporter permease subunit [Deltaproteobacteria bacterium]|nr:efflux RND transporter permease subunit [Deltaproteobacteria bacterium]MBW2384843.1 efflux RND transporter permease subunit [Deltaproteobacteria bacterium]
MKSVIGWFVGNPVAANLLMGVLLFGGILTLPSLRLEVFPETEPSTITVSVEYRGAAPQEVEEGVCSRIEEQLQGLSGIERLMSVANEGIGIVTIKVLPGEDIRVVLDDVKARVDAIDTFPDETEKPIVTQATFRRPVIDVILSGRAEEAVLKELGENIRDEIVARTPVTLIDIASVRRYEISIEVSERALRRYGLRLDDVAAVMRRSSLDLPGGTLKTRGGEILLRAKGQAYRGEDFQALTILSRTDGTRVRLGQVANVVDGFEDTDIWSRFDGEPAVVLQVFRVGDQSSPELARRVREYVNEASPGLPEGLHLTTWQDDSEYFRQRLRTLVRSGALGFLLVIALLAIFMRLRLAFWVALGVPISIAGALFLMPVLDLSINIVSLFSFILVLGILVDDGIVVGENVHAHRERGLGPAEAALAGASEVSRPVVFAVLTSIAAFASLIFIPGNMGQIFANLPMVVIPCFGFSLVASLLVLPAHLANAVGRPDRTQPGTRFGAAWLRLQDRIGEELQRWIQQRYLPFLERAIDQRYLVIATAIALLLWSLAAVGAGWMRFSFLPEVEAETITARLTMPVGTPVEVTADALERIEAAAERLRVELEEGEGGEKVFRHTLAAVGEQPYLKRQFSGGAGSRGPLFAGAHLAEMSIELAPAEARRIRAKEVADRWREFAGPVPDAVELVFSSARFSAGHAIDIELRGSDVEVLRSAANEIKRRLATQSGVYDISDSFRGGKQEIRLRILPAAEALGLSLDDLARQVRQAFYGEEVQRIQRGRDDVRVMVRYPEDERHSLGDLWNLRVRTPQGDEVPFSNVAQASLARGYSTIHRADRQRVVNVTASVDIVRANANQILAEFRANQLPEVLLAHPGVVYRLEGEQREQRDVLGGIARAFALALASIYVLLAVPLRSYLQPLVIMSAIPFGLVGAIGGHLLLGFQLSMLSLFGMVALSGVVVNSSLVYVDFINRRRDEGVPLAQAVCDAAGARFRPVVLTSATTFVGLSPLMLERSAQAQFVIPMAVALAFGIVFSTLITLVLVPCGYVVLEHDLRDLARRALGLPRSST